MKTILCLLAATAFSAAALAQVAKNPPPKPVVISSYRVLPKPGHAKQLEAALAAHAKKFHRGDHAWRVGQVLSGPDGNMYHITEGPTSWTAFDGRGDLGAEHTKDYEANVAPHVETTAPDTFVTFQPELSTIEATKWTNKVAMTRLIVKPGRVAAAVESLKKRKAVYEKLGLTVVVWRSAWSGETTFTLVNRLKDGFKEFDEPAPEFRQTTDALFGAGAYDGLQHDLAENFSKIWSELVEFKPELSSP
jgi:hypothetical protein